MALPSYSSTLALMAIWIVPGMHCLDLKGGGALGSELTSELSSSACWPESAGRWANARASSFLQDDAGPSAKVTHTHCLSHTLDHEWNYFHLFERNLLHIFSALHPHGLDDTKGSLEEVGSSRGDDVETPAGLEPTSIIFDNEVNTNTLTPWLDVLLSDRKRYVFAAWDIHPEVCCSKVERAGSYSGSWREVVPQFREFMYQKAGVSLLQHESKPSGGAGGGVPKKFCFFNRDNAGRARVFTNMAELVDTVKEMSYEPELLAFEGKSPIEQVEMVSGCDVGMGIHGAGLTNFMWLPPEALAIQIRPYSSSSPFQESYQEIAEAAGLRYKEWTPSSHEQVQVHWEQMQSDKNVLAQVCECGVRELLEHGTMGACGSDFLNWGFYINQDITVPPAELRKLLGKQDGQRSARSRVGLLQRHNSTQAGSHDATQVETSGTQVFNQMLSQQLAEYKAKIEAVLENLRHMRVEEAEKLCGKGSAD